MTSTYSESALTPRPFGSADLKASLLEPVLVVGVSAFWLVALPFAAVSLFAVKIWDTASAFAHGSVQANPLILRRGESTHGDQASAQGATAKRV